MKVNNNTGNGEKKILTQMNSLKKTNLSGTPAGAYNAKLPAIPCGVKFIVSSTPSASKAAVRDLIWSWYWTYTTRHATKAPKI